MNDPETSMTRIKKNRALRLVLTLAAAAGLLPASAAFGQASAAASAADIARLQAEIARISKELADQKQLILRLMQADQQRYEVLLQLIANGSGSSAAVPLPVPAMPGAADPAQAQPALGMPNLADSAKPAAAAVGTISGKVRLPDGVDGAYVYVEGLRGGIGRLKTVEIKQEAKQFFPAVAVVPVGTKLMFPNADTIFHNVFSKSRSNPFDLGSMKGGERSRPVTLTSPGHVEIFCNIHSKMRADVLVVPSGHFAKVGADGSFQIPGVPAGSRRVVVWAPGIKPFSQKVDVTGAGAQIQVSAQRAAKTPHMNKFGQAYGSYDE